MGDVGDVGAVCVDRGGLVEAVHGALVEEEGLADEEAVVRAAVLAEAVVHGVLEEVVDRGVEDDASSLNFLLQ